MTCSTSCSARPTAGTAALLLCAAALAAAGCGHARPGAAHVIAVEPGQRARIVVLPVENLAGGPAPVKEIQEALLASLERKFDVVPADRLEEFLARRRVRYTGGVDAETAHAAHEELGANAILVTTVSLYRAPAPPAFALAMRLVDATGDPEILWMDAAALAGDQSPGLLRLGIVDQVEKLQERVIATLVGSLEAGVEGRDESGPRCGGAWYAPKVRFRSALLDRRTQPTLAVVPFLDQSSRRGAGELVSLEFVRHLVATGRFRVLEPGVVREYLLRGRVMMPGGASLETSRLMLGALGVDLVVSGAVIDFDDSPGTQGPTVRFSAVVLDGGSGEVVWQSSSYNRGDDGVFAFGLGRVRTSGELSCRMVRDVIRALLNPADTTPSARQEAEPEPTDLNALRARGIIRSGSAGE